MRVRIKRTDLGGVLEVSFLQITANTVLAVYSPELLPTDVRGTGFGAVTAAGCESAAIMLYFVLFVRNGFGPSQYSLCYPARCSRCAC